VWLDTWVHWAVVRSGVSLKVYRNGVEVGSRSDLPAATAADSSGAIGSNYYLKGKVDEVAVYNTALTAAQIPDHYDAR